MRVLIETRMNALRLTESKTPKKGCLGRLEGVCADFKNPTRNGRLYPIELWKKVFDDELFQESLKNKTLFGELDHPEDRFEPLMTEACVVMTDYKIDEDAGLIYGGFDILDTPSGRILKSIVDYGSVVGVSSRGQGDIVETADGERVDEDSYEFACFDVVSTPAVAKARQKVMESVKRVTTQTFEESVKKQIADAKTVSDLNIIRSVVRTSNLNDSEIDSLVESIEDRCKAIQQSGETITGESGNAKRTSDKQISAKTIRDNAELYRCIESMRKQIKAYKHREDRYIEMLSKRKQSIDSLDKQVTTLRNTGLESQRKHSKVQENLGKRITESKERLIEKDRMLTESSREIQHLRGENRRLTEQLSGSMEDQHELNETVHRLSNESNRLKEQLVKSDSRVKYLESQVAHITETHKKDIDEMDSEIGEYTKLLSEAQEELSAKSDTIRSLRESLKERSDETEQYKARSDSLASSVKSLQRGYIDKSSKIHGVDAKSIYNLVTSSMTPQQIDSLIESVRRDLDRANKVGITDSELSISDDTLIESTASCDDEDKRLLNFLNFARGSN